MVTEDTTPVMAASLRMRDEDWKPLAHFSGNQSSKSDSSSAPPKVSAALCGSKALPPALTGKQVSQDRAELLFGTEEGCVPLMQQKKLGQAEGNSLLKAGLVSERTLS